MVSCKSLPTRSMGEEIFKCVDNFFKEHKIVWSKCVGLITDSARATSSSYSGLVVKITSMATFIFVSGLRSSDIHKTDEGYLWNRNSFEE